MIKINTCRYLSAIYHYFVDFTFSLVGLYFRPEYVPDKLSQFRGIAVRLEDNILVTKSGPVNLSQSVSPREKVFACDADSIQSSVDIHNFMASLRKGKI